MDKASSTKSAADALIDEARLNRTRLPTPMSTEDLFSVLYTAIGFQVKAAEGSPKTSAAWISARSLAAVLVTLEDTGAQLVHPSPN